MGLVTLHSFGHIIGIDPYLKGSIPSNPKIHLELGMTHETIQIVTACGNILAALISIAAMISSTRSAKKAKRCRDAVRDLEGRTHG